MMKLLRDCFTGVDGETWDLGRIMLAIAFLPLLGGGARAAWLGSLDYLAFAGGIAALFTGGGALLLMKRQTEPTKIMTRSSGPGGSTEATIVTGAPAAGEGA